MNAQAAIGRMEAAVQSDADLERLKPLRDFFARELETADSRVTYARVQVAGVLVDLKEMPPLSFDRQDEIVEALEMARDALCAENPDLLELLKRKRDSGGSALGRSISDDQFAWVVAALALPAPQPEEEKKTDA